MLIGESGKGEKVSFEDLDIGTQDEISKQMLLREVDPAQKPTEAELNEKNRARLEARLQEKLRAHVAVVESTIQAMSNDKLTVQGATGLIKNIRNSWETIDRVDSEAADELIEQMKKVITENRSLTPWMEQLLALLEEMGQSPQRIM